MIVYRNGERDSQRSSFTLFICPAADMRKADCPSDWLDDKGAPRSFEVEFRFGRAEVPSNVGEYLLRRGLASKTRLIIPDNVKVA